MKVDTPSKKNVASNAEAVGVMVLGGAVSKGVVGLLPQSKFTKLGIAAASLVGAAAVKGSSATAKASKNALLGMAIVQGMEGIQEIAAPATQKVVDNVSNPTLKSFVSRTVGLGSVGYPAALPPIQFFKKETPTPGMGSRVIASALPEGV